MNKFLLDTTVFNDLLQGQHSDSLFLRRDVYYITHHQQDELAKTPIKSEELANSSIPSKRERLLSILRTINPVLTPTPAMVLGFSNWSESNWTDPRVKFLHENMLIRLKKLDAKGSRKKEAGNQIRDVLTSLAAIENGMVLITNDKNLSTVTKEFGGRFVAFEDFVQRSPPPRPSPSRGRGIVAHRKTARARLRRPFFLH